MNKLKKNDEVKIIAGRDRGKVSKISSVLQTTHKVIVEKVNIVKRHMRANQKSAGGIIEIEKPLDWSNVMLICRYCKKPVKVSFVEVDGNKMRKCKNCGEIVDK